MMVAKSPWIRIPKRYLPFLLVGLAILFSQGFLVYCFFGLPKDLNTIDKWSKPNVDGVQLGIAKPRGSQSDTEERLSHLMRSDCVLNGTEIVSALTRAKTTECRDQLSNVYCKQIKDELYIPKLESFCPTRVDAQFLGCFKIESMNEFKEPYHTLNNTKNVERILLSSAASCVQSCITIGRIAAVYNEKERRCFCSNQVDSFGNESRCSNCTSTCLEVHTTGLHSISYADETPARRDSPRARIVFLITVNGRALRQIKRLIHAIKNTANIEHYFLVHVDERQDYLYRSLKELENNKNFVVTNDRFSTIWGGSTLLQMLLSAFEKILSIPDWEWDYIINLSESDFPVRRVDELEQFLGENMGYNFIRSHGQDTPKFISKQALLKTFHQCEFRMWKLNNRELPKGIRFDGGSDWISLHHDFVQWVVRNRYSHDLLLGLESLYRQTLLPAESYFHTVLHNSQYCSKMIDNNLRYVNWRRKQGCKCQYKHIVDWCGCSPNVLLKDDEQRLESLRRKSIFFARKFEPIIDQTIILSLERKLGIRNSRADESSILASYWQNEFHYLDRSPPINEGRFTAWSSLARMSIKEISRMKSRCILRNAVVLEVFLYFTDDVFKGLIVKFEAHAEHLREPVKTEVLMRPITSFERSGKFQNHPFDERLRRIEVSSEFDVKELFFRNFAGILSVHDEIGVLHEWDAGPSGAVTFVWVDPASVIAGSYEVQVSRTEQIQHHKPPLRKPLRPGKWSLKMFHKWVLMAETSFIVLPQTNFRGVVLKNSSTAVTLNSGPENGYTDSDLRSVEDFLKISEDSKSRLLDEAVKRGRRISTDLENWADSLNIQRWSLENICFLSEPTHITGGVYCPQIGLTPCHYTSWSTLGVHVKSNL